MNNALFDIRVPCDMAEQVAKFANAATMTENALAVEANLAYTPMNLY